MASPRNCGQTRKGAGRRTGPSVSRLLPGRWAGCHARTMSTLSGLEFSRCARFTFCWVEPGRPKKLANASVVDPVMDGDALSGGERVDTLQLAGGVAAASMGAVLLLCRLGKISICRCELTRLPVITCCLC